MALEDFQQQLENLFTKHRINAEAALAIQKLCTIYIPKNSPQKGYIGRYKEEAILGKGGVGTVHLMYDEDLNRHIALSQALKRLASNEAQNVPLHH